MSVLFGNDLHSDFMMVSNLALACGKVAIWREASALKHASRINRFHMRVPGFESWVSAQFRLTDCADPGKQQALPQGKGSLLPRG